MACEEKEGKKEAVSQRFDSDENLSIGKKEIAKDTV